MKEEVKTSIEKLANEAIVSLKKSCQEKFEDGKRRHVGLVYEIYEDLKLTKELVTKIMRTLEKDGYYVKILGDETSLGYYYYKICVYHPVFSDEEYKKDYYGWFNRVLRAFGGFFGPEWPSEYVLKEEK